MGPTEFRAKSGVVYRDEERAFLESPDSWERWVLQALKHLGIPLHRLANMCRIADDDLALSSCLCPACTGNMGAGV